MSWATCGVDPSLMGSGPIPASKIALDKANWKISDLDLVESNEAFAAQSLAVIKDLGIPKENISEFLLFCDEKFPSKILLKKSNEFQLIDFLVKQSDKFRKILKRS